MKAENDHIQKKASEYAKKGIFGNWQKSTIGPFWLKLQFLSLNLKYGCDAWNNYYWALAWSSSHAWNWAQAWAVLEFNLQMLLESELNIT